MKFSDGEKIIMLMLSDLYEKLGIQGEIDHRLLKSSIIGGHSWAIDWHYGAAFPEDDDYENVKFVADVLDMWSFIESHFRALPVEQQRSVQEQVGEYRTRFAGFDGNNETEFFGIARFLVRDLGRFTNFSGHELDSHMPTVGRYREMLRKFTPLRPELGDRKLTSEELITILSRD